MNFNTLANKRFSVRNYTSEKVTDEQIEALLDTARKAPSAVNFQPYKVYAVRTAEKLDAVKKCYHRSWLNVVPVILVVVGNTDMAWKRAFDMKNYTDIDSAIFIDHINLQAADMGLGTCCVCNFDVDSLSEILGLLPTQEPIAMITLGYPEDIEVPAKKRKGLDELVEWL
ncbi:MAG TPA: nitroreductase family protein [Prolixibacteraceae bacterium]|nr:nitroreductase family protein [Prolixibacteraceae bacterium]